MFETGHLSSATEQYSKLISLGHANHFIIVGIQHLYDLCLVRASEKYQCAAVESGIAELGRCIF